MVKVAVLKAFDAGNGIVKKGDIIEIPLELLPHFLRNSKVAEIKAKSEKVEAKIKEVKEVIKAVKKARKSKFKK